MKPIYFLTNKINMKPTRFSNCLASVLLLFLRLTLVTPQVCNVRCFDTMDHPATSLYALKISENHYPTWKTTNLNVKVYRTKCPELNTPGPAWYKVEAFLKDDLMKDEKQAIGKFDDLSPNLKELNEEEILVSHDNSAVEFSTWQSLALYDLPRTFRWSKKAGDDGIICFRLTLLVDVCRQTVQCIQPTSLMTTSPPVTESQHESGSGSGELDSRLTKLEDEDKIPPIPEHCKFDCTNVKQGNFCSNPFDGHIYSSRCEWRIQKCALRARGVDVETDFEVEKCDDPVDNIPCWERKLYDEEWTRGCQCNGLYKPLQCGNKNNTKCWCSDVYGNQLKDKVDVKCKDPETYDRFSTCIGLYS